MVRNIPFVLLAGIANLDSFSVRSLHLKCLPSLLQTKMKSAEIVIEVNDVELL